jgi:hypothetical protein
MGYSTYFYGKIEFSNERFGKIIDYMVKNNIKPFDEAECIIMGLIQKEIEFSEGWKNYGNNMENICLFIANLDNKAEGEITCEGEEREDNWKIIIQEGKVSILRGEIIYEEEEDYCDENTIEKLNKILNDKELNKKLILHSLENGKQNRI